MIDFNENDFNITKIKKESKLSNLVTKYSYRIYGLAQESNPLIWIRYSKYKLRRPELLFRIGQFLIRNNLQAEILNVEDENKMENTIKIGLRRDLRNHVVLSAAILQTIIYGIEERIDFNKNNRNIPGIPKFK